MSDFAPPEIEFAHVTLTKEGVGTHYTWTVKVAGLTMEGFNVFTEFVPNERITDRSSSSLEGTWTYLFAPDGGGTKLTVENRVGHAWRIPPVERLLDRLTAKTHEPRFARIKAALEARVPHGGRHAQRDDQACPPRRRRGPHSSRM